MNLAGITKIQKLIYPTYTVHYQERCISTDLKARTARLNFWAEEGAGEEAETFSGVAAVWRGVAGGRLNISFFLAGGGSPLGGSADNGGFLGKKETVQQCCGSGSGRIKNYLLDPERAPELVRNKLVSLTQKFKL